jgi:hypothetical protein
MTMTREVLVLIRRATMSAVVLVGAAVATFALTASDNPSPSQVGPSQDAPSATIPPSAHALAPPSSASSWPQMSHL